MKFWLMILLSLTITHVKASTWLIQNQDSRVSFITTKQGNKAEVSHFETVVGGVEQQQFSLKIPLSGVQTGIDIRNQRMQKMLFEVAKFPEIEVVSVIDDALLSNIKVGQQKRTQFNAEVSLHGLTQTIQFDIMINKLSERIMTVSSFQPIIVNAASFNLSDGVTKLREVAGLDAISEAVPVFFRFNTEASGES